MYFISYLINLSCNILFHCDMMLLIVYICTWCIYLLYLMFCSVDHCFYLMLDAYHFFRSNSFIQYKIGKHANFKSSSLEVFRNQCLRKPIWFMCCNYTGLLFECLGIRKISVPWKYQSWCSSFCTSTSYNCMETSPVYRDIIDDGLILLDFGIDFYQFGRIDLPEPCLKWTIEYVQITGVMTWKKCFLSDFFSIIKLSSI